MCDVSGGVMRRKCRQNAVLRRVCRGLGGRFASFLGCFWPGGVLGGLRRDLGAKMGAIYNIVSVILLR